MAVVPSTDIVFTPTGGANIAQSITVPGGCNAIVVRVAIPSAAATSDITAMSFNGTTATNGTTLTHVGYQDDSNVGSADMWFALVTAATANLRFNSNHGFTFKFVVTPLAGVAASALGTALTTSGSGNLSVTLTTVAGDWVASVIAADPNTTTFAAANGQTVSTANTTSGNTVMSCGNQTASGISTVDGYTVSGAGHNSALVSVPVHAAAGGGGRTFFMQPGLDGHSNAGPTQFNPTL